MPEPYLAIQVVMMPRDTNPHGTIFGGVILSYLDQAGAIGARHAVAAAGGEQPVLVTVAMNRVEFTKPVLVGDVVRFLTRPVRMGRTSIDQVSEPDCGVVTRRIREHLIELGRAHPDRLILADSRERVGEFREVWLKPNRAECVRAVPGIAAGPEQARHAAIALARRARRPVFCTCGADGIFVVDSRSACERTAQVPAYPVAGPIDVVGAGDSTSAALACALAAGATLEEAAAFGSLVASITIQQIGTTGTASPEQVRQRWREAGRP